MNRLRLLVPLLALMAWTAPTAHAAGPQLHVSILVDRMTARPGDVVHYEVRVENVGDSDTGVVRITSHYPAHTSAAEERCPDGILEPDGDICLDPSLPTPGIGDSAHQVNHSEGSLAPGAALSLRFAVKVDADAPLGTHLGNHAHASSATAPEATSAPVDTLVVATIPNAVFGANGVSASGQTVTDSWDSSAGTLDQTEQAQDGDIASNGDISVSGSALVNGDATPGPGHSVTVANTALVTGSTAPATAAVALDDVDASAYATNNDDHRICRDAGSCDGASFDPSTRTLTVSGTAILPTGAYFLCRLDVSGVLRIVGNVAIWLGAPSACGGSSRVTFESTGSVSIASAHTRDFQLKVDGPGTVKVTSHSSLAALLYAPHGSFGVEGQGAFLGSAWAAVADLSGHALVHIDRALAR